MCALNDKVVIVTGGSSGIGRAASLSLAAGLSHYAASKTALAGGFHR